MAGQSPNSPNIERVAAGISESTGVVVHPEYMYWRWEWRKLRDVIAGQREVKRQGVTYLKSLPKQDQEDYLLYLERATFYNMTRQTLNSMVGQVFNRDPIIVGIPKKFKNQARLKFGKDGSGHVNFCKGVITEQIAMGRYGVLVDAPAQASTTPTSFAVGYAAENILDWTLEDINGEYKPTRILLREFKREERMGPSQQNPWIGTPAGQVTEQSKKRAQNLQSRNSIAASTSRAKANQSLVRPSMNFIEAYTYRTIYRELLLEPLNDDGSGPLVYKQNVYDNSPNLEPSGSITPLLRGNPLDFIPFEFFGATSNTADVEQSPILDIADLNISHYRTYAELEWGRMFTALPVYYAPGGDGEGTAEYNIGPSMVWEVPAGEAPGILEYKGEGLKQLESGLATKENQIHAIGGRMMPGSNKKGSSSKEENDRATQNEQALLLHAIQACEAGMTKCTRWWLMWRDVALTDSEDVEYIMNRIFGESGVDARTLRALQQLHDDGKAPIDVIYFAMLAAGYLDPETSLDEFKDMLANPDNFPNNPDIAARQRGFSSRAQELEQAQIAREADMQQQEIDLQEREVELMENQPQLPPTPPKASAAALPPRAGGPAPPKPGKAGSKTKAPAPGGQSGGSK